MKMKKTANKTERISVRCTERDKQILEKRAESLGMRLSDYVESVLFPRSMEHGRKTEVIGLLVELQDIAAKINEKYADDSIQEDLDLVWEKLAELW